MSYMIYQKHLPQNVFNQCMVIVLKRTNKNGMTPLIQATHDDNVQEVENILALPYCNQSVVTMTTEKGLTALRIAIQGKQQEIVDMLTKLSITSTHT